MSMNAPDTCTYTCKIKVIDAFSVKAKLAQFRWLDFALIRVVEIYIIFLQQLCGHSPLLF